MKVFKLILVLSCLLAVSLIGCATKPEPAETAQPAEDGESSGDTDRQDNNEETQPPQTDQEGDLPMIMALTSPSFNNGESIPTKYTCDSDDISPELDWFGIPEGTVSMALIMDDPDAPVGTWVHWVLFNLPMDLSGLREGMTGVGLDGTNSWNRTGYGGPCPPSGTHRYFFKLYALDSYLDLESGADKKAVLAAMEGRILGQAELMGTYSR